MLSGAVALGAGVLTAGLVTLGGGPVADWLGVPAIAPWFWALPVVVSVFGIRQGLSYWATRRQRYRTAAAGVVMDSVGSIGVPLVLGVLGWLALGGLVAGRIVAVCLAALLLAVVLLWRDVAALTAGFDGPRIRAVARRFRDLPRYAAQTSFVNSLSAALLPLLVTKMFEVAIAGVLLFSMRLVLRPVSVIVSSVWQVGHSQLPTLDPPAQKRLLNDIHRVVSLALALPTAVAVLYADVTPWIFGDRWDALPVYLAPIVLLGYFNGVSNATSYFAVFGRFKDQAWVNITLIVVRAAGILGGGLAAGSLGAVWAYSLGSALVYLGVNVYWGKVLDMREEFARNIGLGLILCFGVMALARLGGSLGPVVGAVSFVIGVAVCAGGVFALLGKARIDRVLQSVRSRKKPTK